MIYMKKNNVIVYHNPRCSKSSKVVDLLKSRNIQFDTFLYLDNEISHKDFLNILALLKLKPRDVLRKKEKEYQERNLDNPKLTDTQIIEIILKNRKLIERPIVMTRTKAVIARPPEKVFEIF